MFTAETMEEEGVVKLRNCYEFLLFFLTLQNELTPNQANVKVKQVATTTRPNPVFPASYFENSCARAIPPLAAITRKTRPVTSSHN